VSIVKQYLSAKSQIIMLSLFMFLMQYTTMIVLSQTLIAYSLALFQLSMVLQVVLGYRIFKEQNIKRRLFSCLIMIFGSMMVLQT
jgi:drug/metabolite transporter (DMT)-like permease